MKNKIKIAFVTSSNPLDKKSWSGIYYQMLISLQNKGIEIHTIGPIPIFFSKTLAVINKLTRFFFKKGYNHKNSIALSFIHSKYIQFKLGNKKYDYIFAPAASTEIAYLNTDIPIIYCSDSSFGQLNEYYDTYSNLFKFSVKESNFIEQKAILKASYMTYPSQWAKDYIEKNYSKKASIEVIPFGANIDDDKIQFVPKKMNKLDTINFLFLGVDWDRKGGEIVYQTFLQLLEQGYKANLTVCGCLPTVTHSEMKVIPFLNKNDVSDLEKFYNLLQNNHFLFLPSKAECFGIVFCEASAFGIPSITRNTGGISNAVYNGINGFCLDEKASAEEYLQLIKKHIDNPQLYEKLSLSARKLYLEELNWDKWANELLNLLRKQ